MNLKTNNNNPDHNNRSESLSQTNRLFEEFSSAFGRKPELQIISPGRTEICGNHCDHQNGCVIAGAVDAAIIGFAAPADDMTVHVISKGHKDVNISVDDLSIHPEEAGNSPSIVRGIAANLAGEGIPVKGFRIMTSSRVPSGSGLSSSAAFENLITETFLAVSGAALPASEVARVGQYAENKYFGKPSGLMDQTASACGGLIFIDFKEPSSPMIRKSDFDLTGAGYSICLTNTGGSHAGLTAEYAAIPFEMKKAAEFFGKEVLRDVDEEMFFARIPEVRKFAGDRAVLRAMHFFEECRRSEKCFQALESRDVQAFLDLVNASGDSSWRLLQNIYPSGGISSQNQAVGLALSEKLLNGKGAFRIHGGGFEGTVQAFVPDDLLELYITEMNAVFGPESCNAFHIQSEGIKHKFL